MLIPEYFDGILEILELKMLHRKSFGRQYIVNTTPISIADSDELPAMENISSESSRQKSLSSTSSTYKPVNCSSEKFKNSLAYLKTPSGIDRVVNWMDSNKIDGFLPEGNTDGNQTNDTTFFRYDYKVDESGSLINNSEISLIGSVFNRSIPMHNSPVIAKTPLKNASPNNVGITNERFRNIESNNEPTSSHYPSRNGNLHFSPSSAEIRKKELCNYLKLMNHADKKEVCLSLYRRSMRVKNLEQKELARKLLNVNSERECSNQESFEVNSDKSNRTFVEELSNIGESITLQSFNDLHMTVDSSKYPTLQEKKIFNFVMPPSHVLDEFNDFQLWIEPLLKKRKYWAINTLNGDVNSQIVENYEAHNLHKKQNSAESTQDIEAAPKSTSDKNELNKLKKKYRDKSKLLNTTNEMEKFGSEISSTSPKENTDKMGSRLKRTKSCDNVGFQQVTDSANSSKGTLREHSVKKSGLIRKESVNSSKTDLTSDSKNGIKRKRNGSVVQTAMKVGKNTDLTEDEKPNQIKQEHTSPNKGCLCDTETREYCCGFTKEEINQSCKINLELGECLKTLSLIPQYFPNSVQARLSTFIENVTKSKDEINLNVEKRTSDQEMEEIQSESDTASNSLSSFESDDSSGGNSIGVSENENDDNAAQKCNIMDPSEISPILREIIPFNDNFESQTLHSLLKKQVKKIPSLNTMNSVQDWDSDNSVNEKQKLELSKNNSHFISIDKENGTVQSAIYVDFYLILVQDFAVSLWNQTALGHVLGAQNLWIFNGDTKKLILNKECIRKKSLEMVISIDTSVAYVELWSKEHKSDIRQGPVADIFAIVYFWMQKSNKMDKKVLQLENINGFADDVQYVVLKPSLNIVVTWHSVVEDNKVTLIHLYTLAPDFQKIVNVRAMARVDHYVSSLHNIEDCEELLMGCGEHKITLWNIEHGYIVASIELSDIKLSLSTLWVKCDRGILFTVQQCVDRELRLIAINGRSHSWKRLKSYKPPDGFDRIQNVYIENGVLVSFYEEGILCWKAQSGEQIVEEVHSETDIGYFPSGKYLIMTTNKNVFIRHALTHLLTVDD